MPVNVVDTKYIGKSLCVEVLVVLQKKSVECRCLESPSLFVTCFPVLISSLSF